MINHVGTIWGDNGEGQPKPVAVYRVGSRFELRADGRREAVEDQIEAAVAAATEYFGLKDPRFGPSRLPVRGQLGERRGSHESYGWQ